MNDDAMHGILQFMQQAENLKNTLRHAYTSTGRQESAAEHSWRLSLLALLLAGQIPGVNREKLLQLAIVHDLAEAVCGDVPAIYQTQSDGRAQREREGFIELCAPLPEAMRKELLGLWDEYAKAETVEARLAKGLDKLETLLQHNQGLNPEDFDYRFNLSYGREYTNAHPVSACLRALIDQRTQARLEEQQAGNIAGNSNFSEK